ncbi:MAG: primosomal protein N' [Actinomycetes bacterium]
MSTVPSGDSDQLALVSPAKTRKSRARVLAPAPRASVAAVAVDLPLPHLDRPFDYLVPAHLDDLVVPGCRVRVRLAGRLLDGFVLDRSDESEHGGKLAYLDRIVSAEPVLTREIAALCRAVADRQAGTLADVVRLAVPPRHAAVEKEASQPASTPAAPAEAGPWSRYPAGASFLDALQRGDQPRAVWTALPGPTWPVEIALAAQTAAAAGRGVIVVVPDARDLDRVDEALAGAIGRSGYVALQADLGPAERYRRFLAVSRGAVRIVLGTRASVFAPVAELGLLVVWDSGDDSLAEPRAPYPHARDVAILRAHRSGAAIVLGGLSRTAEEQALLATNWAHAVEPARAAIRATAPRVEVAGDDAELSRDPAARSARLPSLAWRRAKEALAGGAPVLVQVPRRGYVPALRCTQCRARAACPHCSGPLSLTSGHAVASCRWCGRPAGGWRCADCGGQTLRAAVVGAARTAEELGRAFPGVPVRTSGGDAVLAAVPAGPAVVVATPGAEPVVADGYGAVLLLDAWALLTRADLRAGEEAVRRWFAAASLARPAPAGGRVVVVAAPDAAPVQALLRWSPQTAAQRELDDRTQVGFPPAVRLAELTGAARDVADLLAVTTLPATAEVLGPVPHADVHRAVIRVSRPDGAALAEALKAGQAVRGARRDGAAVRVRLDPVDLL